MTCVFVVAAAVPAQPAGPEPGGWQLGVIMAGGVIAEQWRARAPDASNGPVR